MRYDLRDMTRGNLWKQILVFSLPLMASNLLQVLFNMSDIAVVGQFAGSHALGSVGSTATLAALYSGFLIGMGAGVNVLTARFIGAREEENTRQTVHTAAVVCLGLGLILMALCFSLARPLLTLLGTKDELIDGAILYLRIYAFGLPAMALYNFGSAVLTATGDTKRPLLFLSIAGGLNICLNLFFVIVCGMSVDGVATATVISQYISLFLVVRCLRRSEGLSHLELKSIRLDREESLRMIQIGLPAGLQSTLFSISNVLIQSSVNSFGASVVAANTAAASIEGFVYTAMNSVFHAAITFTSQNLGAGKIDRIKKVLTACLTTVLMIGLPLNLICYLFGPNLLSIYVSSADATYEHVIHYGVIRLHRIGCIYFLCGIMEVMCGMVRGLGKSWLPMFVTGVGACLSRIIWIYTIFQVHHTPEVLYSSYPMSWILTLSMHAVCFFVIYRQYERKLAGNTPAAT